VRRTRADLSSAVAQDTNGNLKVSADTGGIACAGDHGAFPAIRQGSVARAERHAQIDAGIQLMS
jgi:hypothetical protein